jgi:hypothetical protein
MNAIPFLGKQQRLLQVPAVELATGEYISTPVKKIHFEYGEK